MVAVDARPPAPREQVKIQTVPSDGLVPVESNRYPVPLGWAGRAVRVHLRAEEIVLSRDGEDLVRHARLSGKHQVARWNGPPRNAPPPGASKAEGPPQWDPAYSGTTGEVEVRSLGAYEAIAAGASS
jgi:hypothetical protein